VLRFTPALLALALTACTSGVPADADLDCAQATSLLDVGAAPGPGASYVDADLAGWCAGDSFVVEGNGLPHYTFIAMTPNALEEADHRWELPTDPTVASSPSAIPLLGQIGFTVGGTSIFGPNEAEFPDPYGDPVYNGIVDGCAGHTAFEYHNHALDERCLSDDGLVAEPWTLPQPDGGEPSPIIGWAFDGFAIYGSFGCADADCTEVVEYVSGYQQIADPSTYAWDAHEYVASSDDRVLDACNGHVGPEGDYHYHATSTFPYVLGCYAGTPAE